MSAEGGAKSVADKLTQMFKDLDEAQKRPGYHEARQIEFELEALAQRHFEPGEAAPTVFLRICKLAEDAYSGSQPGDLLANAAAEPLLRYLLRSMRTLKATTTYGTASEFRTDLIHALHLGGLQRSPGPTIDDMAKVWRAYSTALPHPLPTSGDVLKSANWRALKAAFRAKHEREFMPAKDERTMKNIVKLLREQGYYAGPEDYLPKQHRARRSKQG